MKKIIKSTLLFAASILLWHSCENEDIDAPETNDPSDTLGISDTLTTPDTLDTPDPLETPDTLETKKRLDTITMSDGASWHNKCNFTATYKPYSTNSSYDDNIHQNGEHVVCAIDGKIYLLEFVQTGSKDSHFHGDFHVLEIDGQEIVHEDGIVWKEGSYRYKLKTFRGSDTSFIVPFYKLSNVYGNNSLVIPETIANKAIDEAQKIYQLDTLKQNHIDDPNFENLYFEYPYIETEGIDRINIYYNEEKGYYCTYKGSEYTLSRDQEMIIRYDRYPAEY